MRHFRDRQIREISNEEGCYEFIREFRVVELFSFVHCGYL